MTLKALWGVRIRIVASCAVALSLAACSDATRQGQGSTYLIVTSLQGAPGATPGSFGTPLLSDVVNQVGSPPAPTFFNDLGQVTMQLAMKDPGGSAAPQTPTQNNFVTIDRYHVEYVRSDGHNVPGVDVPFAFDGAVTVTVSGTATFAFTIVRNQAKEEAPLKALQTSPVVITTIAQVTFYGHDQTGRGVTATGSLEIAFGNFAG